MSRFLANSQAGCEFLVRELSVRRSLVRVVHNGVELPPAVAGRVTWRKRLEVDDTVFVACMLGHLTQRKDHLTLLQAWSQVVERRQAVLVVAGHLGPGYGRAKNLVEELGLGQHVRFLGFVSDVAGLLSAADIGVFSSRSEGCPNGVLECMAAGLPVVATDIAGVREALGSAGAPFLAPPGDSDTLAQRILWLADARDVRAEAARSNRERAASVFSPRRMCELTLEWLCDGLADCS